MSNSTTELNVPTITKSLLQVQGVEHVLAHGCGIGSTSFTVIIWTAEACVDATITTSEQLAELTDIVECHVTDALVGKKRKINFRITH